MVGVIYLWARYIPGMMGGGFGESGVFEATCAGMLNFWKLSAVSFRSERASGDTFWR